MALSRCLKSILDHYGIPYEVRHHAPTPTAAHLAEAEHVSGYRVAKTVFLSSRDRPVAVVLPSCQRLDLDRVKGVLGDEDVRLATEPEIAGWFRGCEPGAVPPLRLRSDLVLLMDRGLAHLGEIVFPAGSLEEAVVVRFRDWYRAVRPGVGHFTVATNGRFDHVEPPTVLVVEDEPETNRLLCRLLERRGFACRGVEQGGEALTAAREMRPSALLLDLMLPDMTGFDVYERLRKAGPFKRIPVIIVTALDDDASRQRGEKMGADAYLTKPFMPDTLVTELREVLADA